MTSSVFTMVWADIKISFNTWDILKETHKENGWLFRKETDAIVKQPCTFCFNKITVHKKGKCASKTLHFICVGLIFCNSNLLLSLDNADSAAINIWKHGTIDTHAHNSVFGIIILSSLMVDSCHSYVHVTSSAVDTCATLWHDLIFIFRLRATTLCKLCIMSSGTDFEIVPWPNSSSVKMASTLRNTVLVIAYFQWMNYMCLRHQLFFIQNSSLFNIAVAFIICITYLFYMANGLFNHDVVI